MIGASLDAFREKLEKMDRDKMISEAVSLYIEKETLNTRLTESQNASSEMVLQFQHMRDELNAAKHEIDVLSYSTNHEESLRQFLSDGNIPIDDGATERSIRPIAQGRRNYLFSNTIAGAKSTAIASTMIETAKANGADPYYYLKYLLEKMPAHLDDADRSYLSAMMPWSDAYKLYEKEQKQMIACNIAPPGNSKPKTPRKKKRSETAA